MGQGGGAGAAAFGLSTEHPRHEGHDAYEGDEVSRFKGAMAGVPGPRPSG